MTKESVIELLEIRVETLRRRLDLKLEHYPEDSKEVNAAMNSYYELKWVLMDIKEKDELEIIDGGNHE